MPGQEHHGDFKPCCNVKGLAPQLILMSLKILYVYGLRPCTAGLTVDLAAETSCGYYQILLRMPQGVTRSSPSRFQFHGILRTQRYWGNR